MAEPGLLGGAADIVPDPLLLIRLDGAVLDCNQAASRLVPGMRPGVSIFQLLTDPPDSVTQTLTRWARTSGPLPGTLTFHGQDGPVRCRCLGGRAGRFPRREPSCADVTVVQVYATPLAGRYRSARVRDQVATLNREVSFRQRIAAERERLLEAERNLHDRARRQYRLSAALASSSTLAEVARVAETDAAVSLGGLTAVLGLFPEQVLPSFREQAAGPTAEQAWHDLSADPGGVLAVAAQAEGPALVTSPARPLAAYSAVAASHDHAAFLIPLTLQERRLGVLAAAVQQPPVPALLEHEHALSVAAQVAQALARAGLFEHEHHLAEWLQRSLLPTLRPTPRLSVATRYLPNTESVLVGGDWYDLFGITDARTGLVIGDVAGHSLAEATVMAQLQNALRAIALEQHSPGETLKRLNEFTLALLPTAMATVCFVALDTRSGRLSLASAGHLPPVLVPADGPPSLLRVAHGPPVGVTPDARYPVSATRIRAGDILLLYTDGLVEHRGESLDTGLDRLLAVARRGAGGDPGALCDLVIRDQRGTQWQDDRALLAVRFGSPPYG